MLLFTFLEHVALNIAAIIMLCMCWRSTGLEKYNYGSNDEQVESIPQSRGHKTSKLDCIDTSTV